MTYTERETDAYDLGFRDGWRERGEEPDTADLFAALREALEEWVAAERAYWAHVGREMRAPDEKPDFGPFIRWKAAQSAAYALVRRLDEASPCRCHMVW